MSQPNLFSSGLEFKTLLASTTLLRRSWAAIADLRRSLDSSSVQFKVYKEYDLTIMAFLANQQHLEANLVSSTDLRISHFKFLCTKNNPSFSVNKSAIELFCSLAQPHDDKLNLLKSQIDSATPLIVTGHGLGGSIASLFTLWLLDTIGSGKKRPLCITFGSPAIGDDKLQKAISKSSTWNSCFLHLANYRDPLPRSFISHPNYKPFGTFLLCSEYGASCFETPESTLEVLQIMGSSISNVNQGFQDDYGEIVEDLHRKAIRKEFTTRADRSIYSYTLEASINVQLQALGLVQTQQQQQNINIKGLIEKMQRECMIMRRKKFDPSEKLNNMKINMAYLEWYKKRSKESGMGYYDAFKTDRSTSDQDVVMFKKNLTLYWEDMVAEAEMKPQREGSAFRTRWLFAGTNYRRMVEPLDIAEYYKKGGKNYVAQRSTHYIQLEKWLEEDRTLFGSLNSSKKQNVESLLTLDSCFWAHVEEAALLCETLKGGGNDESRRKLIEFENYVFGLLKKYEVSSEIFLEKSSYMSWWKEYARIMGVSHNSALANFMRNPSNYKQYTDGAYDFY